MKFKNILMAASVVCTAGEMTAQLHENISVEGRYVPEIIRVDRVNTLPRAMSFTLNSSPLSYDGGGVAAGFTPSLLTMPATGWRSTREVSDGKGYLEFGVGSWLNSTLSAGCRIVDDSNTLFGVRLQHNSTSLWKPKLTEATEDVKQYRYDESLGFYGSHVFAGLGRLDAAVDYHLGVFDYYAFFNPYVKEGAKLSAPGQTLNDFSLKADWHSLVASSSSVAWNAALGIRHYGFRSLPLPALWDDEGMKGDRETDIELSGGLRMPWENGSSIGLDAALHVLAYAGGVDDDGEKSVHGSYLPTNPDNYGMLMLTPYYRFTKGLLDIRLGADIDLAFNAGPDGNRYSFLHVAPDVKFAIQSGQAGIYLNLLGGSQLNTLASLREHDYYMMPALSGTRPTYTPIDATLGLNLGPFSGFSVGIEGSFRSSRNVPLGGWYQAWMNYGTSPLSGMVTADGGNAGGMMLYSLDSEGINLHGVSAGAYISYKPSDSFSLNLRGTVQPQDEEKGYFNGYDRPKVTGAGEISFKPMAALRVSAGIDYRGKRRIYTRAFPYDYNLDYAGGTQGRDVIFDGENSTLCSYKLPDITLLNLSASYDLTKSCAVWIQGDNLLNKREEALPLLPMQGISVVAGLKVVF